jgi:hypothetical protein
MGKGVMCFTYRCLKRLEDTTREVLMTCTNHFD